MNKIKASIRRRFPGGIFSKSIAGQLLSVILLSYILVSVVITTGQIVETYSRAKSDLARELQILGQSFNGSLAKALWEFDEESLRSAIMGFQEIPGVLGVRVLDLNSGELHTAGRAFVTSHNAISTQDTTNGQTNDPSTDDFRKPGIANLISQEFDIVFEPDGRAERVGRATVFSSTDLVIERIESSVIVVILSELFKLVVVSLIFMLVSYKMLRKPLGVLTEAAERLSKEDLKNFKVNLGTEKDDELKLLEDTLNVSAEKLYNAKDELENRMRLALTAGRVATWVWYPDKDVLNYDTHLPSVLGQPPETFGHSFKDMQRFIHPDDLDRLIAGVERAVSKRSNLQMTYRTITSGGGSLFIDVQGFLRIPSDASDEPYFVGTVTDVTENRRAAEELEQARASAEEANRAKSEFLASMSHELRTPLNAILGFSEVLKGQYLGPLGNDRYQEYASDIHSSGDYLLQLVDELLDLSAIEAGKIQLNLEPTNLDQLVEECLKTVSEKASTKSISLNFDPELNGTEAEIDRRAIKQVVINLLSNAVKFTQNGGAVRVVARQVAQSVQITVIDNGPGIAADQLETISSPFKRGENPHHVKEKGWGLGLAISRSLVELHKGEFVIESTLDEGTTITISLPLPK